MQISEHWRAVVGFPECEQTVRCYYFCAIRIWACRDCDRKFFFGAAVFVIKFQRECVFTVLGRSADYSCPAVFGIHVEFHAGREFAFRDAPICRTIDNSAIETDYLFEIFVRVNFLGQISANFRDWVVEVVHVIFVIVATVINSQVPDIFKRDRFVEIKFALSSVTRVEIDPIAVLKPNIIVIVQSKANAEPNVIVNGDRCVCVGFIYETHSHGIYVAGFVRVKFQVRDNIV